MVPVQSHMSYCACAGLWQRDFEAQKIFWSSKTPGALLPPHPLLLPHLFQHKRTGRGEHPSLSSLSAAVERGSCVQSSPWKQLKPSVVFLLLADYTCYKENSEQLALNNMAQKPLFKKRRVKISPVNNHTLCLLCLSKEHDVSRCTVSWQFISKPWHDKSVTFENHSMGESWSGAALNSCPSMTQKPNPERQFFSFFNLLLLFISQKDSLQIHYRLQTEDCQCSL